MTQNIDKALSYNLEMSGKEYYHKTTGGNYKVNKVDALPPDFKIRVSFNRLYVNENTMNEEVSYFINNYLPIT